MLARSVQYRRSIMSDAPFGPAAGFRCLKICRTISFSGPGKDRTFRRFPCFAGRRRRRGPAGVYLFVRHGIRVAVHPAWPSFRRSRHGRRLSVDCRRRRSCLCSCARSDPPTGHLRAGGRAQGTMALIDPKVLSVGMQAGRALGWQRLIPLALLGFLAAQWMQEARREDTPDRTI